MGSAIGLLIVCYIRNSPICYVCIVRVIFTASIAGGMNNLIISVIDNLMVNVELLQLISDIDCTNIII